MASKHVDPITLEVMRNGLYSIADEMIAALVRTSYSTNIKDRRDASCAVYGSDGALVAQSAIGTPLHLGTMNWAVHTAMEAYPFDQLEPGDALAFNLPYPAGPGHLNDLTLISPVFWNDAMVAIVANQAHHVDMGGFAPGSMPFGVSEIYQEGLQIPPIRLFRKGELVDELWRIIQQNVRSKTEVEGDLMAQFAANVVGGRRFGELVDKYGVDTAETYLGAMLDYSERRMRAALQAIPVGRYSFEDVLEGDGLTGQHYTIRLTLEVRGDSVVADFTATDAAARGPLNCRLPSVAACVFYVLKAALDPDLPPNAGAYRPIEVLVRDGSLLSAQYPEAVCNANILTTQRIVDVLLGALAEAIPERVLAACSGTMNLINVGGVDRRTDTYFNYVETYAGGQGGMHDLDGMDAVQNHMTNTRNAPVEAIESAYPLRVEAYGLEPDSEGAGAQRGGCGLRREIRVLCPEVLFTLSSDRAEVAPWGLEGGSSASPSRCFIRRPDGSERHLPSKVTTYVEEDETIVIVTPGGGGWGDPARRDPELVAEDVRKGLISVERARDAYHVAVSPTTLELDVEQTAQFRRGAGKAEDAAGNRGIP